MSLLIPAAILTVGVLLAWQAITEPLWAWLDRSVAGWLARREERRR